MPLAPHPLVGTIRVEPLLGDAARTECDDLTLPALLSSFAHLAALSDGAPPAAARLVTCKRIRRLPGGPVDDAIRADLAQLVEDLQAEYDELARTAGE
jgi:hypothetical protein